MINRLTRITVPLVILAVCVDLQGQVKELGVRAGVQASGFFDGAESLEGGLAGFYAGLYADHAIMMSGFLSFSPGIEYMQAGHRTDQDNFRRIHYLSLPLAVRMHFGPWYVQTGVNANFRMAETFLTEGQDVLNEGNRTDLFDLPIQLGLGLRIAKLTLEGKFNYGFMDVNNGYSISSIQVGLSIHL